ncbi:Zn-ribbon domain-containing OB-fold protein [Pseudorhodoferax sp.]|uniref:Zn-ribbon domain-containing OB-fold protein n=1 Tax=Pseudorhodoferax sp. TaxID=1993553 RepID=UPI002DD62181|nr:OB-fold domain-containing protein [Pseudorhodoferax sp.]
MLIVPQADALTQPYWDGVAQRELRIQHCQVCGHCWHPPLYRCPQCHSEAVQWRATSGRGTLYSHCTVHHAAHVAVADKVPYLVALVTLQEGPRVVSNLLHCPAHRLRIGMPLRLAFQQIADGVWLPQFEPEPA